MPAEFKRQLCIAIFINFLNNSGINQEELPSRWVALQLVAYAVVSPELVAIQYKTPGLCLTLPELSFVLCTCNCLQKFNFHCRLGFLKNWTMICLGYLWSGSTRKGVPPSLWWCLLMVGIHILFQGQVAFALNFVWSDIEVTPGADSNTVPTLLSFENLLWCDWTEYETKHFCYQWQFSKNQRVVSAPRKWYSRASLKQAIVSLFWPGCHDKENSSWSIDPTFPLIKDWGAAWHYINVVVQEPSKQVWTHDLTCQVGNHFSIHFHTNGSYTPKPIIGTSLAPFNTLYCI